jgi:hypothetical protein
VDVTFNDSGLVGTEIAVLLAARQRKPRKSSSAHRRHLHLGILPTQVLDVVGRSIATTF